MAQATLGAQAKQARKPITPNITQIVFKSAFLSTLGKYLDGDSFFNA